MCNCPAILPTPSHPAPPLYKIPMADGLGNELLATCFLSTARCLATMTLQFLAAANNFRAADDSGSSKGY